MYSFMENYNDYNQVEMVEKDKVKPTFILEWGAYAYNVLWFGLCNFLVTFQEVITKTFKNFLNDFMQALLDNFNVYGNKGDRMYQLQKCL